MRRLITITALMWIVGTMGCVGESTVAGRAETHKTMDVVAGGEPVVSARPASWTMAYSDGSGNGYRFWLDTGDTTVHYEFDPMTRERSSSGTYSGGSPAAGTLDAAATDALWQRVEALEAATAIHAEGRAMGTGQFVVITPDGERRFLVQRGAELEQFDNFLGPYRGS